MANIATFSTLLAIFGACLLLGRLRKSSKFFGTLIVAMALGVVAGTFVTDYLRRTSNPTSNASQVIKGVDNVQGMLMQPLYSQEAWGPTTSWSDAATKVLPETEPTVPEQQVRTPERRTNGPPQPSVEDSS